MSIPRLFQETSIFKPSAINDFVVTEITAAKATIKVTTDAIIARVTQAESAISSNASRLTSAESSITQNASSIALKANSSDVYTKTQSDGLISTEVTNRNAAISTAVDNLTLSVSNTYATKNELSTEEGKRKASWAACSTAAGTQAKVATCANFELYNGALVSVLFQNTNTHATPTLNVNSTGAKSIRSQTGQALSEGEYKWPAGCVRTFVYDGTYWRLSDDGTLSRVTQAEASISVNADNIASKVSTTDYNGATVASLINQSASTVKIAAQHVEIDGTATFNAIKSSADAAYDAKGAASTAESNAKAAIPTKVSQLSNDSGYQTSGQVSTAISTNAASKADALKRSQRIYRRETSTATLSGPTTWLSTSGTGYGNWSTKVPPLTSGSTKYPYLYTCVQTQTVSQAANGTTCTCSSVLLDDTATIIDGGSIITGSVAANAISATSGTFDTANIPNLSAAKITSGDISAARIKANVISAINSLTAGTIDAARINAANLTIGYSQISDTPTIPTTTSQLTNNSGFGTTTQIAEAKSEAISSANSATDTKLESYSTTTEVDAAISTEANQRKAKYGTCSTSAGTQAKVVTCSNFELVAGNELTVKFSTANTYTSGAVQLNVNSKGAKNVWVANAVTSSSNQLLWGAGAYITFRYDGTQFVVIGEPRSWYGASTTAAATAAKTDTTAVTGCVICKGTTVNMHMSNANSVSNPTLNVQSTGAIAIYTEGSRPTATGATNWSANATVPFVFDGQYWKYDADAIRKAADAYSNAENAKKTATNYLTTVDSTGLMVHPSSVANTGVKITDVVDIMRSGTSVAQYGDTQRIGPANKPNIKMDSSSLTMYGATGTNEIVSFGRASGSSSDMGFMSFEDTGLIHAGDSSTGGSSAEMSTDYLRLTTADSGYSGVSMLDMDNSSSSALATLSSETFSGNYPTCNTFVDLIGHSGVIYIAAEKYQSSSTTIAHQAQIYLNGNDGSISFTGTFNASNVNSGTFDAARIPNLAASKINSGTLALARGGTESDNTSTAINKVFAGPSSGSAGNASFRSLVAADIPSLAASKINSGTLALARGGTNSDNTSIAANKVFAGPSSGDAGSASFRSLINADIPNISASKVAFGTVSAENGGTGQSWVAMKAGTTVVTLNNGTWAPVVSSTDVATYLGSGANNTNTIAIVQNGDFNASSKLVTGAIDSNGSVRAYLSSSHTGGIRFNWLLIRFA